MRIMKKKVYTEREQMLFPDMGYCIEKKLWSLLGLGNPKKVTVWREPVNNSIIFEYE